MGFILILILAFLFGLVIGIVNGIRDIIVQRRINKQSNNKKYKNVPCQEYSLDYYNNHTYISNDISFTDGMEGHDFECFCADLLHENGFTDVSVTPGSGDQGVDVLATKDGIKYAIQCKSYSSKLSNTPIQEVYAGKMYYNCHVGVVMTNSYFTKGAVQLAQATGVLLWNREYVQNLLNNVSWSNDYFNDFNLEDEESDCEEFDGLVDEDETEDNKTDDSIKPSTMESELKKDTISELIENKPFNHYSENENSMDLNTIKVPVEHDFDPLITMNKESIYFQKSRGVNDLKESTHSSSSKLRAGMIVCMVIFFILSSPMLFLIVVDLHEGLGYSRVLIGIACLFDIPAIMFLVLTFSPKDKPYILGKSKGVRKPIFVVVCIILAFTTCVLSLGVERIDKSEVQPPSAIIEETTET